VHGVRSLLPNSSHSPVHGARNLLPNSSNSPVPGARSLLPNSSNRQVPGAVPIPPSNNLRPGATRAPAHHQGVSAWGETNPVGMPPSQPSNQQPRRRRTPGDNPQHLLCSKEHLYGVDCLEGRPCQVAPRHNNSKRLLPTVEAAPDSRGANLTSQHLRSKDGGNLPNNRYHLQHLHLRRVAIRACHHGSKDQTLGKVRDLAPLL
jgi:hypothetical protein